MRKYVAYYRVSTARQGVSGLGLEAQQATVQAFAQGGHIIREYTEVESGKRNQRPQLLAAIDEAKRAGATLLIAKLDRLSRNAGFIFALRDSGVDFTCCDMPDANTLTVGIFAVIAQHERETISKRTKEALAAKKARGETLGSPQNLTDEARRKGNAARRLQRQQNPQNRQATSLIMLLREQGVTYRAIAQHLNTNSFRTAQGNEYTDVAVQRLYNHEIARQCEKKPST